MLGIVHAKHAKPLVGMPLQITVIGDPVARGGQFVDVLHFALRIAVGIEPEHGDPALFVRAKPRDLGRIHLAQAGFRHCRGEFLQTGGEGRFLEPARQHAGNLGAHRRIAVQAGVERRLGTPRPAGEFVQRLLARGRIAAPAMALLELVVEIRLIDRERADAQQRTRLFRRRSVVGRHLGFGAARREGRDHRQQRELGEPSHGARLWMTALPELRVNSHISRWLPGLARAA